MEGMTYGLGGWGLSFHPSTPTIAATQSTMMALSRMQLNFDNPQIIIFFLAPSSAPVTAAEVRAIVPGGGAITG